MFVLLVLSFIVCVPIGIILARVNRKAKEAVALLETELDDITRELRCIQSGSKNAPFVYKESLIRREHEIVRTLALRYPKITRHKYKNYQYRYDD